MSASSLIAITCQPLRPDEARPETLDLIAYWEGRRTSPALPARRDLDVLDLRPWLGRASLYEVRADGDFFCRLRGSTMCSVPVPGHAADGILVSQTQPRPSAEMGLAHYRAALDGAAPTIHRIELDWQGFAYDYERACASEGRFGLSAEGSGPQAGGRRRVALPLAAGAGLPPMVLTFIACDIDRSRRFWERYAAGAGRSSERVRRPGLLPLTTRPRS